MLSTILWKLLFIALGIAVIIAIIVIYFYKTSQSIKYERRITDFALSSVSDSELSLFDRLTKWLGKLVHNLGSAFAKLKIFKKSIKKYEKYKSINPQYIASDYLGLKLLVALILMILNIITTFKAITILSVVSWIVTFFLGYYIVDLVLSWQYNKEKQQLKKEIFPIITFMNNAFASGHTIYQTIDMITKEYKGFVSQEFQNVAYDLNCGLSIYEAIDRMEKRVDIKEITYISSALSILNSSGGSVINIFKIIEKDLLNQKTIKDEISLNMTPLQLIYRISLILPIICYIIIKIVYKGPLFTNFLNIVILITVILLYLLYILIMQKFLKEGNK